MKCTIPEISWHNRDPVLSVDIQPSKGNDPIYRVATGGTDSHVLIWLLSVEKGGVASLECAADLTRHSKPVNCVRFSPSGDFLATGDDESCIIVWKMKTSSDPVEFPSGEEETFKEQWISVKVLRGHLQDVYDLCWSADSKNLISGSVDNTAILWEVSSGKNLGILGEHKGFVQGVAWDPCGQYVATMSSDRVCRVYNVNTRKVVSRMYKGILPGADPESKVTHFFHDDTLKSFFRRLTFTPDGELLIIPSGLIEEPNKNPMNATMVFSRNCLNKPAVYLPSLSQYTVAVRCCPVLFTLRPMQSAPMFALPYRVVIAVATQCSVVLYDTQHAAPFAFITNIHYTRLTDLSWSSDGRVLLVSSTDGYCSVVTFAENELGTVYTFEKRTENEVNDLSNEVTPNTTKEKEEPTAANSKQTTSERKLLDQIEDANMPIEINSTQEDQNKHSADKKQLVQDSNTPSETIPNQSVTENKETPMELDDFQLVYEGTLTEPAMNSKPLVNKGKLIEPKSSEDLSSLTSSVSAPNQVVESERESVGRIESSAQSPNKSVEATKLLQQEALTSPKPAGSGGINVTPGNSNKKTPRRVQLITLSSPKSKKKLLQ